MNNLYLLFAFIGIAFILLIYMAFFLPLKLNERHFFIRNDKKKILDITKAFDLYEDYTSLNVAHFSDTRFSHRFRPRHLNAAIRSTLKNKPDLIVFSGNLIEDYERWPHHHNQKVITKLKKMRAPLGKFAVFGSQDYINDGEYFVKEILKEAGFTILVNEEKVLYGEDITVSIIGLDDATSGKPNWNLIPASANIHLCILHDPEAIHQLLDLSVYNLILSGQTAPVFEKENELKQYTEGFYLVSPSTLLAVAKPMRLASFFKRFRQKPELNYYHFTTISLKE